jgi:hypothetical protein
MCPHGNNCRFDRRSRYFDRSRRPCGFFHPGEKITKEEVFRRATEFSKAKPVEIPGSVKRKTDLCAFWNSGCHSKDCDKAHSKEELAPVMCKFGARCRKRSECRLFHPGDVYTQDSLFEKARRKLDARERFQAKLPQFVVSIDESEEEEPEKPAFSLSSLCAWADDEEDPDYDAPITFAPIRPNTDADLTEVDMDMSE